MRWKLTTLIENHVDKEERYMCEHGLAILIERKGRDKKQCSVHPVAQLNLVYQRLQSVLI